MPIKKLILFFSQIWFCYTKIEHRHRTGKRKTSCLKLINYSIAISCKIGHEYDTVKV